MRTKTQNRLSPERSSYYKIDTGQQIMPSVSQTVDPNAPLTRAERVDLLFKEMMRISDPYHKAVDNYYRILAVPLPIIGALYGYASKGNADARWLSAIVPFACLIVVMLETQIRTTIMCASKYLAIMERRISHEAEFPALLYERNLSLGNFLYYRMSGLVWHRGVVYFALGFALFSVSYFAYCDFVGFLDIARKASLQKTPLINGLTIDSVQNTYTFFLLVSTLWVLASWVASFVFAWRTYEREVEEFLTKNDIPIDRKIERSSNR